MHYVQVLCTWKWYTDGMQRSWRCEGPGEIWGQMDAVACGVCLLDKAREEAEEAEEEEGG
jgi:hypothetical protein